MRTARFSVRLYRGWGCASGTVGECLPLDLGVHLFTTHTPFTPLWTKICENITLLQTSFAGGQNHVAK